MSEKKGIFIPLPEGYEQCEPIDATHVLLGRANVYLIDKNNLGHAYYKELATGKWFPTGTVFGNITAYLRKVPKPEPFHAEFEARVVPHTVVEGDNHGHPYERVVSYCVVFPLDLLPRNDMRVRVEVWGVDDSPEHDPSPLGQVPHV